MLSGTVFSIWVTTITASIVYRDHQMDKVCHAALNHMLVPLPVGRIAKYLPSVPATILTAQVGSPSDI